jgi:hypothetical protein
MHFLSGAQEGHSIEVARGATVREKNACHAEIGGHFPQGELKAP